MRSIWESLFDEKFVFCGMAVFFSCVIMVLIRWNADKEYIAIFGSGVTGLIGALMRGVTHKDNSEKPKE
jgi:hypothetical protein